MEEKKPAPFKLLNGNEPGQFFLSGANTYGANTYRIEREEDKPTNPLKFQIFRGREPEAPHVATVTGTEVTIHPYKDSARKEISSEE